MIKDRKRFAALCLATPVLALQLACQTPTPNVEPYLPRLNSTADTVAGMSKTELDNLQLVSTNLVSALLQLPETNPSTITLQVSTPGTAFGNLIVRALEEAGYSLQHVSADQGMNYVRYSKRHSETEAGFVVDYNLSIGMIKLRREYITNESGIFPSSLMSIVGSQSAAEVILDDNIFIEQGGNDLFISGVKNAQSEIKTLQVRDYNLTPDNKRTTQEIVLGNARNQQLGKAAANINSNDYTRMRRTVLIFDNRTTSVMGRGNKRAISLLAREHQPNDVYSITACTDADGEDESAHARAVRVQEEFMAYKIPAEAIVFAPCIRASFRHTSDESPVPVTIEQLRFNY
ncbi:MAG: hypothetical protein V3U65_02915 [Granulosicoccaceae bacterium]